MNAFLVPVHIYHEKGNATDDKHAASQDAPQTTDFTVNSHHGRESHAENNSTESLNQLARAYAMLKGFVLVREMSENETKANGLHALWSAFDVDLGPPLRRMNPEEKHRIRKFDYQGNTFLYQKIGTRDEMLSPGESSLQLTPHEPLEPVSPSGSDRIRKSTNEIVPNATPAFGRSIEKSGPMNSTSADHSNFLDALAVERGSSSHAGSRGSVDPVRFTFGSE